MTDRIYLEFRDNVLNTEMDSAQDLDFATLFIVNCLVDKLEQQKGVENPFERLRKFFEEAFERLEEYG